MYITASSQSSPQPSLHPDAAGASPAVRPARRRRVWGLAVAVLLAAGSFWTAAGATAEPAHADRSCAGVLKDTVIRDNVTVPRGRTCDMTAVRVNGNITLESGSTLRFRHGSVGGNVQGESSPALISVFQSTIDGDLQVKNAGFARFQSGRVFGNVQAERTREGLHVLTSRVYGDVQAKYTNTRVERTTVNGDVQHEEGSYLAMYRNQVGGDTQVFKNRAGWQEITGNTIRGNLQCKENRLPRGWSNVVHGSKEDQCRRF
ncbi:hypothetical protein [Microbacterium sp. A93]|uniref:hypothetical protein n=1 Tax=Microbacterium sp. A93 TaxID=3450716 RepID=UPI003F41DAF2